MNTNISHANIYIIEILQHVRLESDTIICLICTLTLLVQLQQSGHNQRARDFNHDFFSIYPDYSSFELWKKLRRVFGLLCIFGRKIEEKNCWTKISSLRPKKSVFFQTNKKLSMEKKVELEFDIQFRDLFFCCEFE